MRAAREQESFARDQQRLREAQARGLGGGTGQLARAGLQHGQATFAAQVALQALCVQHFESVPHPLPAILPVLQVPDAAHSDHLVLARLALARTDPLRAVDAREAVKAAALKARRQLGARLAERGPHLQGDFHGRHHCWCAGAVPSAAAVSNTYNPPPP